MANSTAESDDFRAALSAPTDLVNRGRTIANLDSRLLLGEVLVARANGNYSIFRPRGR